MKCESCGREFEPGNRPDGLPNGVGFQLTDGAIINVCTECIMLVGEMKLPKENEDGRD